MDDGTLDMARVSDFVNRVTEYLKFPVHETKVKFE